MSRTIALDPARPLASLREALGLTTYAIGKAREVATSTVASAEDAGGKVQLSTLIETARALGYEVEIRVTKGSEKKIATRDSRP